MSAVTRTVMQLNELHRHINKTARSTVKEDDPVIVKELMLLHYNVVESGRKLHACINGDGSGNESLPPLEYTARLTLTTTDIIEQSEKQLDMVRKKLWSSSRNRILYVSARIIQACYRGYYLRKYSGTFHANWVMQTRATRRIQVLFQRKQLNKRCAARKRIALIKMRRKMERNAVRLQLVARGRAARTNAINGP